MYYDSNVRLSSLYKANPYGTYQNKNYNSTKSTTTEDTVVISESNKKKNNKHIPAIIATAALAIAAIIGTYKGHNKISKNVDNISKCAQAYKKTHANMSLKGLEHAGKEVCGSVGNLAKSVVKVPGTILKETFGLFKKTVK